jgi:hypothetical protein
MGSELALGLKMLLRGRAFKLRIPYVRSFLTPLQLFSFFSYLQRFPGGSSIGVRASLVLPKRLGLIDTQARGTALPRWPRRHSQLAISPPQIAIRESQNLRWEMHTGILAAVRGTAESNGIKAVNLVAMPLVSDTPASCSPWVQSPGMTLPGCWGCKGPIVRGDVRNDPGCCFCLVAGDRWHACWWPTCGRSSRAFCGPSAEERNHRPACSVSLLPRLASRV